MFLAINTKITTTLVFFIAHGLLKAASFIFIGLIILIMKHKQDYRYAGDYGTLFKSLFVGTLISVLTLGSAPLTIMSALKHVTFSNNLSILTDTVCTNLVLMVGSLTSLLYSLKIISLVFCYSRNRIKLSETQIKSAIVPEIIRGGSGNGCKFNWVIIKISIATLYVLITITALFYLYGLGLDFDILVLSSKNRVEYNNNLVGVTG